VPEIKETQFSSTTPVIQTGCGKLYLTLIHKKDGTIKRVQAVLGKAGGCAACQLDTISFLTKIAMKYGCPRDELVKGLKGRQCSEVFRPTDNKKDWVLSCSDGVGKLIEEYYAEEGETK
jgi:ribonucleoside-diphosphate reductase alpha chain